MDNLQKANKRVHKQQAKQEATKIGGLLNLSDNLCGNCGHRYGHADETGRRAWCSRCITVYRRKELLHPTLAEVTISRVVEPLYVWASLDDLDVSVREKLTTLSPGRDVFMFGTVGAGKTHAMAALIRHYVYEGFECRRINFDDFCVEVRSTMTPAATQAEWDLIKPMKEVDKLFIDDLGIRAKQETDFAYVTLYSILNKRQERRLPTFISSNKNIQQLGQQFDARIASRLSTAEVIELRGKDRRKE